MAINRKDIKRSKKRVLRVRSRVKKNGSLPRVSVFRSLNHIYAQIIDDVAHKTLASCSSLELKEAAGDKSAIAKAIGLELAQRAKKQGIAAAVFDRGGKLYHGRVKALAEGLREGGLNI